MLVHKSPKFNVLFIHVPKTGGSSINRFLEANGYNATELWRKGKDPVHHFHYEMYKKRITLSNFNYKFTVFRDPLDRFISQYHWYKRITKDCKFNINQFTDMTFEKYEKNPHIQDNHIRPQVEFLCPGIDVYDFAKIGSIHNKLAKKIPVKVIENIPHVHKSKRQNKYNISEYNMDRIKHFYRNDYEYIRNHKLL